MMDEPFVRLELWLFTDEKSVYDPMRSTTKEIFENGYASLCDKYLILGLGTISEEDRFRDIEVIPLEKIKKMRFQSPANVT